MTPAVSDLEAFEINGAHTIIEVDALHALEAYVEEFGEDDADDCLGDGLPWEISVVSLNMNAWHTVCLDTADIPEDLPQAEDGRITLRLREWAEWMLRDWPRRRGILSSEAWA